MKHIDLRVIAFLGLALIDLTACSRDESSLWRKHWLGLQTQPVDRAPAQTRRSQPTPPSPVVTPAPKCFIDRFQVSLISQEVKQMEATYADGRRGPYDHGELHFDELPQATIDALRTNYRIAEVDPKRTWTAVDPKQAGCKDYSCFINSLYEKPTHEGLIQYWYFLKTGYPMAATDAYSWNDQAGQQIMTVPGFKRESYLFSAREWQGFWLQAQLLPKVMLRMPSLSVIARIPRGYLPKSWQDKGTCGWARGNYAEGEILLSDPCLYVYDRIEDTDSFFYHSTTHEIAHRLSYLGQAQGQGSSPSFDGDPDFLALSNWRIERLLQKDGTFSQGWARADDKGEWQSEYAKTSPSEDFAELIGTFRATPDRLFAKAPKKYAYAKKKFFDNQGFTTEELNLAYVENAKNGMIETIDQWITPCLDGTSIEAPSSKLQSLLKKVEIDLPVDSSVKACLQKQILNQVAVQFARIRYDEPEGCRVLDVSEVALAPKVVSGAVPVLNEYFKSSERLTDLIIGVQDFRNSIAQEFDGRALILSCSVQKEPERCYELKLASEFDRLHQKFKVKLSVSKVDVSDIEKRRFLSLNAFGKVQAEVIRFYDAFFAKHLEAIDLQINSLWNACLMVSPRVNTDVLMQPYQPGSHYVSPAILQCLNENIAEKFAILRSLVTSDQGVSIFSNEAKQWIDQRVLLPKFKSQLDAKVIAEKKRQWAELESKKAEILKTSYQVMIAQQDWRNTSYFDNPDCIKGAFDVIRKVSKVNSYPFVAPESFINEWSSLVCNEVGPYIRKNSIKPSTLESSSNPSDASTPTETDKASLGAIWKSFQPLMVKESESEFNRCYSRMYFTARMKRNCVLNNWDSLRERAFSNWVKTAEVQTFLKSQNWTEKKLSDVVRFRVEEESQEIGDAIMNRFYEN